MNVCLNVVHCVLAMLTMQVAGAICGGKKNITPKCTLLACEHVCIRILGCTPCEGLPFLKTLL